MAKVTTISGEKVDFGKYADPKFLNIDKLVAKRIEEKLVAVEETISAVEAHAEELAVETKLAEDIAHGKLSRPLYTDDFDAFLSNLEDYMTVINSTKSLTQLQTEKFECTTYTNQYLQNNLPALIDDWATLFQQQQEKLRYIEDTYEDQETLEAVGKLYEIIVGDYNQLDNRLSVLASLCPSFREHAHGHPVVRINLEAKQAYAAAKQAEEVYEQSRLAELGGVVHF